jgi:methyl acetate hydrolase
MTLRHLLTHTSGIGYGFSSPIVADLQQGNEKDEWKLPLLHEPGEQWTYGASTQVLGLIVEKITGESLETYFQERIFMPLGMIDTSFAVPVAKQSRVITAYSHVDGKFQPRPGRTIPSTPTPPFFGDSGLYSTAHDFGQFIRMLLNHGSLGDAKILSEVDRAHESQSDRCSFRLAAACGGPCANAAISSGRGARQVRAWPSSDCTKRRWEQVPQFR